MTGTVEEEKKKVNLEHYWNVLKIHNPGWKQHVCLSPALLAAEHHRHFGAVAHHQHSSPGRCGHQSGSGRFLPPQGNSALSGHTRNRDNIQRSPSVVWPGEQPQKGLHGPAPGWREKHQPVCHTLQQQQLPSLELCFQTPRAGRWPQIQLRSLRNLWGWKIRIADYWSMALMTWV